MLLVRYPSAQRLELVFISASGQVPKGMNGPGRS